MRMRPHRNRPLFWAFLLHRVSGLLLVFFLPFHFLVLGLALEGAAALDGFLVWSEAPLVKVAEFGLVALFAAHMFGGLRLLALELLPWRNGQKTLAAFAGAGALLAGLAFLLSGA